MLGIDSSELLLVALVALVVIGPKDLPKAMRVVGYWVGRARGVARQFRSGFDEMVREAELAEMEKKWAAENARIMAEHPQPEPVEADAAYPSPPTINDEPARSGDPQPAHGPEGHDAPRPVMVEKPQVVPTKNPSPHHEGGASS